MAQTWRVTTAKKLAFRAIDAIGAPLRPLLSPRPARDLLPSSVLVLEPWHIGDVVLATAFLDALRSALPDAKITVLGKSHAEELLRHSGLVDEMLVFDLPWTAKDGKYNPRRYEREAIRKLISRLRAARFDLTIDARMDLRSNLLTWLTKAPMRVGYAFGGGSFFLTHAVAASPDRAHKVDDWLALMPPIEALAPKGSPDQTRRHFKPLLRVTDEERKTAERTLQRLGFAAGEKIIGIHGGASDPRRMWPMSSYFSVVRQLEEKYGVRTLLFLEPDASETASKFEGVAINTSLREMMALFSCCSVILCNDSGPMHIADALDVSVVAVFLTGNPVWHRPYRPNQEVVGEGTGHDFLVAPTEAGVLAAAERQLARQGIVVLDRSRSAQARA